MKKSREFIRFLLRIDNINRILVAVSRVFFIRLPSYRLYYLGNEISWKEIVIPCILRLASALGNGCLCRYRPMRSTFLYFLERAMILFIRFLEQAPFGRKLDIAVHPIVIICICYCFLGRGVNLRFYFYYLRKRQLWGKNSTKEGTNADTPFDFLNAAPTNKKIEENIESIPEGEERILMKRRKRRKLSKAMRLISFLFARVRFVVSLTHSPKGFGLTTQVSWVGIIVLPCYFLGALLYPRHFKYGFFFNGIRILLLDYLSFDFQRGDLINLFRILSRIVFGISFLVCLIVEGRTWTGAPEDD